MYSSNQYLNVQYQVLLSSCNLLLCSCVQQQVCWLTAALCYRDGAGVCIYCYPLVLSAPPRPEAWPSAIAMPLGTQAPGQAALHWPLTMVNVTCVWYHGGGRMHADVLWPPLPCLVHTDYSVASTSSASLPTITCWKRFHTVVIHWAIR